MSDSGHIMVLSVDVIGDGGLIGISDPGVQEAMEKDMNAQAYKYEQLGRQVYKKQFAYYASLDRVDDFELSDMPVDAKDLKDMQDFSRDNDVTLYIQSDFDFDDGRFAYAFWPETMAEFVNQLGITPRKICFGSCNLTEDALGQELLKIADKLTIKPTPKLAGISYPVFFKHIPENVNELSSEEKAQIGKKLFSPTRNLKAPLKTKEELTPEQFKARKKFAIFDELKKSYVLCGEEQYTDKSPDLFSSLRLVRTQSSTELARQALGDVKIIRPKTLTLNNAEVAFATDKDIFLRESSNQEIPAPHGRPVYRVRRQSHDNFQTADIGQTLDVTINNGRVENAEVVRVLRAEPEEYESHSTSSPPPSPLDFRRPTVASLGSVEEEPPMVSSPSILDGSQETVATPTVSASRGNQTFPELQSESTGGRPSPQETIPKPRSNILQKMLRPFKTCFGERDRQTQAELIAELSTLSDQDIANAAANGRYKFTPLKPDNKRLPGTVVRETPEQTVYVQGSDKQRIPTFTRVPLSMRPPSVPVEIGRPTPKDFIPGDGYSPQPSRTRSGRGRGGSSE